MKAYRAVVVFVVSGIGLLIGCQTNGVAPPEGNAQPATYRYKSPGSEAKHLVLNHFKEHPPQPPTSWKAPLHIDHPRRWFVSNQRVTVVRHDRCWLQEVTALAGMGDALLQARWVPVPGKYVALSSDASAALSPCPSLGLPSHVPTPDILLQHGWLYAVGQAPIVGTRTVVVQAEGCTVLVYFIPDNDGPNQRFCFLEGDPDQTVTLHATDGSGTTFLTPGTFIDVEADYSFGFVRWIGSVRTIDELDGDSLHNQVMSDIATYHSSSSDPW